MKIETKEDIANFIESHLPELGGDAYGVNYIAEKLMEWHESELKNLRLGFVVKPKGTLPVSPLDISQDEWIENCERIFGGNPNKG
jgi:hypothetical protein